MKRSFKLTATVVLVGIGLLIGVASQFPDGRLHVVFCDVGQGDAIYIKTPQNHDVVIDGGPNDAVITCLSRHMPFWDRRLDMVVLTHPQADHLNGLVPVLERFTVDHFVAPPVGHTTAGFARLQQIVAARGIAVRNTYTGDQLRLGEVVLTTLWPDRNWLAGVATDNFQPAPDNASVLGAFETSQDLNDFSIYFHVQMGDFDILLTGDGDVRIQDDLMAAVTLPDVEVLKVPHHGSRTGMSEDFLRAVAPELAVISVGATNRYGHPSPVILDMLSQFGVPVLRTDEADSSHDETGLSGKSAGDIEIVSDGSRWWIAQ